MRKIGCLGILVAMVLLLGLGIGTVANANDTTIEMVPQKIELRSFLKNNISVHHVDYISTWFIETEEVIKNGNYILEFRPSCSIRTDVIKYPEGEAYWIKTFITWLYVAPKDNDGIDGKKIRVCVDVFLEARFDNMEDVFEFYKEFFTARKENKKLSMKVKLVHKRGRYNKKGVELGYPKFRVSFVKSKK